MLYCFLLYNKVNQLFVYMYPLTLEPPSHHSPLQPSRSSQTSLYYMATSHQLSVLYMVAYICQSCSPNLFYLPPPPYAYMSVLCVYIFIPVLQTGPSVPSFQIPHICVNIQYLLFSFLLHSVVMWKDLEKMIAACILLAVPSPILGQNTGNYNCFP